MGNVFQNTVTPLCPSEQNADYFKNGLRVLGFKRKGFLHFSRTEGGKKEVFTYWHIPY